MNATEITAKVRERSRGLQQTRKRLETNKILNRKRRHFHADCLEVPAGALSPLITQKKGKHKCVVHFCYSVTQIASVSKGRTKCH